MLRSLDSVLGSSIIATDGEIGKAYNILFDDRSWAAGYLVVETGSWFTRRKVLISPAVLGRPDEKTIPVLLTREQVQSSPDVEADQPVSRQQEIAMVRHCRWTTQNLEPSSPSYVSTDSSVPESEAALEEAGDSHLRSAKEVAGYQVDASDGPLGHITDFIIDDEGWGILDLTRFGGQRRTVVGRSQGPGPHTVGIERFLGAMVCAVEPPSGGFCEGGFLDRSLTCVLGKSAERTIRSSPSPCFSVLPQLSSA